MAASARQQCRHGRRAGATGTGRPIDAEPAVEVQDALQGSRGRVILAVIDCGLSIGIGRPVEHSAEQPEDGDRGAAREPNCNDDDEPPKHLVPHATNGTRAAHTAIKPSAIPAAVT